MKVLWFTNIPMPDVNKYFGHNAMGSGGWMGALLEELKEKKELQLGVATACSQFPNTSFKKDGVEYFVVKQQSQKFRRSVFSADNNLLYLKKCVEIVNEFKPDIVHIHGTERFYGQMLTKGMIECPVVFSVQGIMDSCSEWYRWFGKMSFKEILLSSFFDSLKGNGLLWELREARNQAKRERNYFTKGNYFFGRTDWDKAYVKYFNSEAKYFDVSRIIRKPFWGKKWNLSDCKRHRIIFTNTRHPRKGTELLLEAVKRLKPLFPDIELVLIGSLGGGSYGRRLKNKINSLDGSVKSLGQMNAEQISHELCKSHVFVSASYIENSPNSIAEAQLVGMPVVSSYTGGIPSMIKEGETGLFFPIGDVPLLEDRIKQVFENDFLALSLGETAYKESRDRHNSEKIVENLINGYKTIKID
ncbi:MAG: glycosyltransferase family 4 protein [Desulforegulaceae bacterium]|nr:glycosyltransferase family 4 protein [Desulforegulaceae bacterium]